MIVNYQNQKANSLKDDIIGTLNNPQNMTLSKEARYKSKYYMVPFSWHSRTPKVNYGYRKKNTGTFSKARSTGAGAERTFLRQIMEIYFI